MRIYWYWPFVRPEEIEWANGVAANGHEVVIDVIDRDAAPRAGTVDGVEIRRVLSDVDRSRRGFGWLLSRIATYVGRARTRRRAVVGDDFDLVHYHYLNRFTDGLSRPRGPWVLSVHDVTPHRPRLGRIEHHLLQRVYARPDALVVHHEWIRQRLLSDFDVDPARVHVVHHQVFPVSDPVDRDSVATASMILFFGALRANKGLDTLIAAIELDEAIGLRLHIAGRGDAEVEDLARDAAKRSHRVTAEIGYIDSDRKHDLFRKSSVVALPYRDFTSQSGVLHDAYGHWRPVVVTDVGALGPTVSSDGTGVVVPPGDAHALARALQRMSGPQGERAAESAKRIASERSATATARATMGVYEQVIAARTQH